MLTLVILFAALLACKAAPPPEVTQTLPVGTPSPTRTLSPTPTPTELLPRVVLLAPPGSDPVRADVLESVLVELALQDGMRFERLEALSPDDLAPDLRIVAALSPDPGLAVLAAAAPETQFLAIGIPDLAASGNLSSIQVGGNQPDRQGFLAGYLASVVTPDWRVGVIGQGDNPAGKSAINGFLNGVIFYCGLCRPAYPPFNAYPVSYELVGGAGPTEPQAIADALKSQGVTTVYLAPDVADDDLLEYLANAGLNLVGSETPPPSVQDHWIATIQPDWGAAVREAWTNMVQGQAVEHTELPVLIKDVNEALFSPGRQEWVEQTRINLNAGLIDTGIDLASGERK